jgi:hypothetical protein
MINIIKGELSTGKKFVEILGTTKKYAYVYDDGACPDQYGVHWGLEPVTPEVLEVMRIKVGILESF